MRTTHVVVVVDLFSDRGSIPRASTRIAEARGPSPRASAISSGSLTRCAREKLIWSRSRFALAPAPNSHPRGLCRRALSTSRGSLARCAASCPSHRNTCESARRLGTLGEDRLIRENIVRPGGLAALLEDEFRRERDAEDRYGQD